MSTLEKLEKKLGKGLGPERTVRVVQPATKPDGRTPKRVMIRKYVYLGPGKFLNSGSEYEVAHETKLGVSIHTESGGVVPVNADQYDVIEWSYGEPKSEPLPAAARAEKKPPTSKSSAAAVDLKKISALPIEPLELAQLVRHPENRHPLPADVDELAASMKQHGQLEALVVRRWDAAATGFKNGDFQIISGETRYLAAKKTRLPEVNCRIIECDDATALVLLAIFNATRKDLNAIQKAKSIEKLCAKPADGGGGLTRDAAAKIYGFETGAAASNLVGLLKLPEPFQKRVAAGELEQTFARSLVPYAAAPRLMAAIEKDYVEAHKPKAQAYERRNWESRSVLDDHLRNFVTANTRPIDKKSTRNYSGKGYYYGWHPMLFELTAAVRETLDVVPLPIGLKGKPLDVATNIEAYDALQLPLVKKKREADEKRYSRNAGRDRPAKKSTKEPTAAELKKAAVERAKKLAEHIAGWRHAWLRSLIVAELDKGPKPLQRIIARKAIAALVLNGSHHYRVTNALQETISVKSGHRKLADRYRAVDALGFDSIDEWYVKALSAVIAEDDTDPRNPSIDFGFIDAIAAEQGIDLAEHWLAMQTIGDKGDRDRLDNFLQMHTTEQLQAQAAEWKIASVEGKPKKLTIEVILGVVRQLPLPKSITKLPTSAAAKKPKKGAA